MIEYISNLEKIRKHAALSVAVLIVLLVLFITYLASSLNTIADNTELMKQREWEAMDEFLQLSLAIDQGTLDKIEDIWSRIYIGMPNINTEQDRIDLLMNERIHEVLEYSFLSIIIKTKDENIMAIKYKDYYYEGLMSEYDFENFPIGEELVIINNTDEKIKFGEGKRMFFSGRKLRSEKYNIYAYVGFHEQVRVLDFVSTADMDLVEHNRNLVGSVLKMTSAFMVIVIIYGMFLMVVIRHFLVKSLISFSHRDFIDCS